MSKNIHWWNPEITISKEGMRQEDISEATILKRKNVTRGIRTLKLTQRFGGADTRKPQQMLKKIGKCDKNGNSL